MKKVLPVTLVLFSSVALASACVFGAYVHPAPVQIGATSIGSPQAWEKVASAMESYGDAVKSLEGPVSVPVKVLIAPPVMMHMSKICGETLKQAAERTAQAARDMMSNNPGTGSGGGGGGGYYGGGIGGGGHTGCIYGCDDLWGDVGPVIPVKPK